MSGNPVTTDCTFCGATLVNEDCPNYGSGPEHHLLMVKENGDTFFLGDLQQGRLLAQEERTILFMDFPGSVRVAFCDKPMDPGSVNMEAEWGQGKDDEEAMRYALGAYLGPIDEEYDEDRLRRSLEKGEWA